MIAAQVVSIVAFLISWLWWVTFIVAIVALVLLQVVWCCRQSKNGLFVSAGISGAAGCTCVAAGIIMLVSWKNQRYCDPFFLDDDYYGDNSNYDGRDYCREAVWAAVAFVTAALWFSTTGCIFYFVKSGRHAKWEERIQRSVGDSNGTAAATAIEMGNVQQEAPPAAAAAAMATNQAAPTVETAVAMPADSYILPENPDKVDTV